MGSLKKQKSYLVVINANNSIIKIANIVFILEIPSLIKETDITL